MKYKYIKLMKFIIILSVIFSCMAKNLLDDLTEPIGENTISYDRIKELLVIKKFNEKENKMEKHTSYGIIIDMFHITSLFTIINKHYKVSTTEHFTLYLVDTLDLFQQYNGVCDLLWESYKFDRIIIIPESEMDPINVSINFKVIHTCEIATRELKINVKNFLNQ